jgi:hypothetical protein
MKRKASDELMSVECQDGVNVPIRKYDGVSDFTPSGKLQADVAFCAAVVRIREFPFAELCKVLQWVQGVDVERDLVNVSASISQYLEDGGSSSTISNIPRTDGALMDVTQAELKQMCASVRFMHALHGVVTSSLQFSVADATDLWQRGLGSMKSLLHSRAFGVDERAALTAAGCSAALVGQAVSLDVSQIVARVIGFVASPECGLTFCRNGHVYKKCAVLCEDVGGGAGDREGGARNTDDGERDGDGDGERHALPAYMVLAYDRPLQAFLKLALYAGNFHATYAALCSAPHRLRDVMTTLSSAARSHLRPFHSLPNTIVMHTELDGASSMSSDTVSRCFVQFRRGFEVQASVYNASTVTRMFHDAQSLCVGVDADDSCVEGSAGAGATSTSSFLVLAPRTTVTVDGIFVVEGMPQLSSLRCEDILEVVSGVAACLGECPMLCMAGRFLVETAILTEGEMVASIQDKMWGLKAALIECGRALGCEAGLPAWPPASTNPILRFGRDSGSGAPSACLPASFHRVLNSHGSAKATMDRVLKRDASFAMSWALLPVMAAMMRHRSVRDDMWRLLVVSIGPWSFGKAHTGAGVCIKDGVDTTNDYIRGLSGDSTEGASGKHGAGAGEAMGWSDVRYTRRMDGDLFSDLCDVFVGQACIVDTLASAEESMNVLRDEAVVLRLYTCSEGTLSADQCRSISIALDAGIAVLVRAPATVPQAILQNSEWSAGAVVVTCAQSYAFEKQTPAIRRAFIQTTTLAYRRAREASASVTALNTMASLTLSALPYFDATPDGIAPLQPQARVKEPKKGTTSWHHGSSKRNRGTASISMTATPFSAMIGHHTVSKALKCSREMVVRLLVTMFQANVGIVPEYAHFCTGYGSREGSVHGCGSMRARTSRDCIVRHVRAMYDITVKPWRVVTSKGSAVVSESLSRQIEVEVQDVLNAESVFWERWHRSRMNKQRDAAGEVLLERVCVEYDAITDDFCHLKQLGFACC